MEINAIFAFAKLAALECGGELSYQQEQKKKEKKKRE